jgi:flagellin
MSLMINQNITALNAWRNLGKTDRSMSDNMERLSSGLRINKAADDPSGLVISEQMRAQVVGLKAAIKNSEKGVSMIQTAEGALDKVHGLLDKMRALALDSANSATTDDNMLAANQAELDNILDTITRISDNTQYGTKKLLDGSNANGATVTSAGGTGIATANVTDVTGLDDGVYNLAVTENTAGTGVFTDTDGTNATMVTSSADAAAAMSEGTHTLTIAGDTYEATGAAAAGGGNSGTSVMTSAGTFTGASNLTYTFTATSADDSVRGTDVITFNWDDGAGGTGAISYSTADAITGDTAGLNGVTFTLGAGDVDLNDTFTIAATASNMTASLDGGTSTRLISTADNSAVALTSGLTDGGAATFDLDSVTATDAGTAAIVVTKTTYDATLTEAATGTSGTAVTGFKAGDGEQTFTVDAAKSMTVNMTNLSAAGDIQFTNADNSLVFQIGANQNQTVKIDIRDVSADMLANNVTNDSGFASLADIEVDTAEKATDAIALIDEAIDQISVIRGELGAFQANTLEASLDSLRVSAENLQASESIIRDADMAAEMATFTKYQIMMQAGTAMLAQANQTPQNILRLLQG